MSHCTKIKKKFENQCLKSSNVHDILREHIVWAFHELFLSTKDQMQEINAVWTTTVKNAKKAANEAASL